MRTQCLAPSRRLQYTRSMSVTVVIPHIEVTGPKNRDAMLAQAIDSVYTQSVLALVHKPVVVTDRHWQGTAWAVAQGVEQVKTKWVTLLGDDDWLMPRHHETLTYWADVTGADVIYGDVIAVTGDGNYNPGFNRDFDETKMRNDNYITGGGSLIRTELLKQVGVPQEDSVRYAREMARYEDWAMYIALIDAGAKFHHVAEPLYCMRVWAGNGSRHDGPSVLDISGVVR